MRHPPPLAPALLLLLAITTLAAAQPKPRTVALKPGKLTDPTLVPLQAQHRLDTRIGAPLADPFVPVQIKGSRLRVDVKRSGYFDKTVSGKKPTVIEVRDGDSKRPILVYRVLDQWFASSARVWRGKFKKTPIELLDGDLDGRVSTDGDFIRVGAGVFIPIGESTKLAVDSTFATFSVQAKDRGRLELTLTESARPKSISDLQWSALLENNAYRNSLGLGAQALDLERCAACQSHARYLYENNYDYSKPWDGVGSHDQDPKKPGYTEEGRRAARNASTSGGPDPARAIRGQTRTILHRTTYLGPDDQRFAVGAIDKCKNRSARGYSVLWGPEPDTGSRGIPIVAPGPGATNVDREVKSERPRVEKDPAFYRSPRGYPVSVVANPWNLTDATLRVFVQDRRTRKLVELKGDVFSPANPVHSTRPGNADCMAFVAAKPLARNSRHVAEFKARDGSTNKDVHLVWSFTTLR